MFPCFLLSFSLYPTKTKPFQSDCPRNQTKQPISMSVVIPQNAPDGVFVDTHVFLRHGFFLEEHQHQQHEGEEGHECEQGGESSEGSSIGVNEESSLSSLSSSPSKEDEEEEEEVQSVQNKLTQMNHPLDSLESLDDSLPIKRGLSNYFNGKSKSFQSLSQVAETSDLVKKENPFNKKRRILMSCKSSCRRRASCTSLLNTSSMSALLHSLEEEKEEKEEKEEEEEEEGENAKVSLPPLPPTTERLTMKKMKSFRSPRCFSLSDLNHYAN